MGPAGHGQHRPGLGIHGDDGPFANGVQGPFGGLLQVEIDGESQVFTGLGRFVPQDALHLPCGIDLQLLAAPLAAQMLFEDHLQARAADAVAEPVPLGFEPFVFLFGDVAGVSHQVRSQGAIGVGAAHLDSHLGARQGIGPFAKAQHLYRRQGTGQADAETLAVGSLLAAGLQIGGAQLQQLSQLVAQGGPTVFFEQPRLQEEVIGEAIGGQHAPLAIQQAPPHRIARQQADAVFIGHRLEFGAMEQLQPGQPTKDGEAAKQHKGHQDPRLVAHARLAGAARGQRRHQSRPAAPRRSSKPVPTPGLLSLP